jgi:hypothetical protein
VAVGESVGEAGWVVVLVAGALVLVAGALVLVAGALVLLGLGPPQAVNASEPATSIRLAERERDDLIGCFLPLPLCDI